MSEETELKARGFERMYYAALCAMLDHEAGDAARQDYDRALYETARMDYANSVMRSRSPGGRMKVGEPS